MDTITPLSSITALTTSSNSQDGHQHSFSQRSLGEILQATVLEAKSNNLFILDFSGTAIPVTSEKNLSIGQVLQLQIAQLIPEVELKIVSEQNNLFAGKPLINLGNSLDLSTLFSSLLQGSPSAFSSLSAHSAVLLNSFLPQDILSLLNTPQAGEYLQRLFTSLGLNFETLLAKNKPELAQNTLKGTLLEILSQFQGSERITEPVTNLLSGLELYQLAQIQLSNQNLLILPLPFSFLEQGFLLVDSYEKDGEESADSQDQQKFALHLAMSGLGNIRIEFLKNQGDTFIKLLFDSEEKAQFVSQFSGLLEEMLSAVTRLTLSFASGAESPADSLVQKLLQDGESFINTKV